MSKPTATLREIFNAILDHPIQFEFDIDPWVVAAGVLIVLIGILLCSSPHSIYKG